MAVTVQMPFESGVTEMSQDACVGSSIEHGTTIIPCDLRNLALQRALETPATLCWRKEPYAVERHELSTFHNPLTYRCIVAPGASLHDQHHRVYCPPAIQGVSTAQPMSHSVIRWACSLAVVCGVSLRHLALLCAVLCLMPMTQSSMQRWMDDIGVHVPTPEELLRHRLARAPATAWHMDGADPLGTETCVMVVKDEPDRILLTQEGASEHGEEARQLLQRCQDLGLKVTAAGSEDSQSFTEAIQAVSPHARWPADHGPTVQHSWGPLTKALLSGRRPSKASGAENHEEPLLA